MTRKKTQEEFEEELKIIGNDEFEVLGQYTKAKSNILVRHKICGHEWNPLAGNILKLHSCPNCSKTGRPNKRRKTQEQFEELLFNRLGGNYKLLGEYLNNSTTIKLIHLDCGTEFPIYPSSILTDNASDCPCPKCIKLKQRKLFARTTEQFSDLIFNLIEEEYTVLGEYVNNRTPIMIRHEECKQEYDVVPQDFIDGKRCPVCNPRYVKTHKMFMFILEKSKDDYDDYEILSEYINSSTPMNIRHKCGYEYQTNPDTLLRCGCVNCAGLLKKTTEQFKEEVFTLVGNEYEVIGEYVNAKTKVLMKHKECGETFPALRWHFLSGVRCPICRESKGEHKIHKYLQKYFYNYKRQFKIPECKNINPLPFDFAIFDNYDNLLCLIEYDGRFHYEAVEFFGGDEALEKTQARDKIKTDYCQLNNIPLLRIPYWDFFVCEDILDKEIPKYLNQSQIVSNEVINQ